MTEVKPFIRCVDYWRVRIPDVCLAAYKKLIESKQIRHQRAVYNKTFGSTIVEYDSTIPHMWIIDELRQTAAELGPH